eukprot:UN24216
MIKERDETILQLNKKLDNAEVEFLKKHKDAGNKVSEEQLTEKLEIIQKLREENENLKSETEALKETNEEVNDQLTRTTLQAESQKSRLETFQEQVENTKNAALALEKQLSESNVAMLELQEEVDAEKQKVKDTEHQLHAMEKEKETLNEKITTFQEQETAKSQQIEALQATVTTLKSSGNAKSKESVAAVGKLEDLIKTLQSQLKDSRMKAESATEQLHSTEEKLETMQNEKETLEQKVEDYKESLQKEQKKNQENEFKHADLVKELRERIIELENQVEEMTSVNIQRGEEIQQLRRDLKAANAKNMLSLAFKEKKLKNAANQLTDKERALLDEQQAKKRLNADKNKQIGGLKGDIVEKDKDISNMKNYLMNFNQKQLRLLEEADRAYARNLVEKEKIEEEARLSKLKALEARDKAYVLKLQEQMNMERGKNQKLEQRVRDNHARSDTVQSGFSIRGTRKKIARSVNVGEEIRLHDGRKGVVKFKGHVHFGQRLEMLGLSLTSGNGNCNGTWDGHEYFRTKDGKGLFIQYPQISHVYRKKANGKSENYVFHKMTTIVYRWGQPIAIAKTIEIVHSYRLEIIITFCKRESRIHSGNWAV